MSGILHRGTALKSSPIGVLNGLEYVFENGAWTLAGDAEVEVMAPTVRDSTRFVTELRRETTINPNIMYISASFNLMLTAGRHPAPALPIKDVLVLYQESITKTKRNGEPSDYGRTFARLGVPTALVQRIATSMGKHGIHVENPPIKSSTTIVLKLDKGSVPYTVFAANIATTGNANVRVGYGEKDASGVVTFVQLDDLVGPLSKGRDLEAHAMLAVKAKYSGPPPMGDWKSVKYHLSLDPQLISLTEGYTDDPVAPNITGGADPKASVTLPLDAGVSDQFKSYYLA